ncbi:MAG TPA: GntR family transcriptional regulator [Chloroflexia bacterium]|nr:GntR family transcriptional regulator [Chloroflexia bacterium]
MPIWLTIDKDSGVPIYLQIVDQVKHALEVGILQPGDQLPTVRQLGIDLTLAPNTIVKAYNELQDLGLIKSRPGAGTVVTANLNGALRAGQIAALFDRLHTLVRDAAGLGIDPAELTARWEADIQQCYGQQRSAAERAREEHGGGE